MKTTYYALYQRIGPLLGVGTSQPEARDYVRKQYTTSEESRCLGFDASQYAIELKRTEDPKKEITGNFYIRQCTKRLYDYHLNNWIMASTPYIYTKSGYLDLKEEDCLSIIIL
jgi:hypothetical protein